MPRQNLINHSLNFVVSGIPLDVRVDFFSARRGSRDKFGQQLEPDEGASVDLIYVAVENTGFDLYDVLSQTYLDEVAQKACEELCQRQMEGGYDG